MGTFGRVAMPSSQNRQKKAIGSIRFTTRSLVKNSTEQSNNGGGDGTIEIRATERRAHDRISQFRLDVDPRVRGTNFEPEQSCVGHVPLRPLRASRLWSESKRRF